MRALLIALFGLSSLTACDQEKDTTSPDRPAAPSSAQPPQKHNPVKAPIDHTKKVLEGVKKRNGDGEF